MSLKGGGSLRTRRWLAGFLIIAGMALICIDFVYVISWPSLHPSPIHYDIVESDETYSEILSEVNATFLVSLEGNFNHVIFRDFLTNDTPVSIVLEDWNNTVLLELGNLVELGYYGYEAGSLYNNNLTVNVNRGTADASFELRIVTKSIFDVYVSYFYPILAVVGGFILGGIMVIWGVYWLMQDRPKKQKEALQMKTPSASKSATLELADKGVEDPSIEEGTEYCSACGASLSAEDKFCFRCGASWQ